MPSVPALMSVVHEVGPDIATPSADPIKPAAPAVHPDEPSAHPGQVPAQPAAPPGLPSTDPDQPSAHPVQPSAHPGQPSVDPGRPSAHPGQLSAHPGQPSADPGLPSADPGKPSAHPGQPSVDPGPPSADLGKPSVHPGQLSALPGQPADPAGPLAASCGIGASGSSVSDHAPPALAVAALHADKTAPATAPSQDPPLPTGPLMLAAVVSIYPPSAATADVFEQRVVQFIEYASPFPPSLPPSLSPYESNCLHQEAASRRAQQWQGSRARHVGRWT